MYFADNRSISLTPADGGFIVNYVVNNPDYIGRYEQDGEKYDRRLHNETISKTKLFTDAATLTTWLTSMIEKKEEN